MKEFGVTMAHIALSHITYHITRSLSARIHEKVFGHTEAACSRWAHTHRVIQIYKGTKWATGVTDMLPFM